jgi:aldehyde dehydrogenase (NAD+)
MTDRNSTVGTSSDEGPASARDTSRSAHDTSTSTSTDASTNTNDTSATATAKTTATRLRTTFDAGITKPYAWRVSQLRALKRLLVDDGAELEAALLQDLRKNPDESLLTEINLVVAEIDHALKHLRRWLRPSRVAVPALIAPASAEILNEPLGVVLVIAPWNYPVQLLLNPIVGALAAGNAVVAKPSELAPATSATLARLIAKHLDGRAVAVVEGGVDETTALLRERFDHIFYTGSARVGRIVLEAAAVHLTPVTLELGGKSPVYVDDTTDLRVAARRIAWGKFMNAGQTCVAPDYLLATPAVVTKLLPLLVEAVRDFYGDDPSTSDSYGRIVNAAQFDRLTGLLASRTTITPTTTTGTTITGTTAAGTTATGTTSTPATTTTASGGRSDPETRYLEPTILTGVSRDDPVMSQEIFGPILPIVTVASLDEALAFIRAGDKPLALYAFTESRQARRRILTRTSSGAVSFGAPSAHLLVTGLPFGGVGTSGMGAYHGRRSFDVFSHPKAVLSKPSHPDTLALVYPPFTARKDTLVRKLLSRLR